MELLTIISETLKTPFGQLTILVKQGRAAAVVGAGFGTANELIRRVAATRPISSVAVGKIPNEMAQAVSNWIAGDHQAFSKVAVDQIGTDFRQECWSAMRRIKPGETISYSQLAQMTSSPTAVRAAASACAQNLIAPLIPCHRIIKTDGSLGRYGYGEALKMRLLEFEGAPL